MKKKSIAFIIPDLNKGGAEKITTLLANELVLKEEYRIFLILLRKEGPLIEELSNKVEIIDLKVKRIRQSIFKTLFIIYQFKFDLVFCGYGEVNAFISPFIPFFSKTKFIARETNVVSEHVKNKIILFFYRFYNNFHKIIAQSNDMVFDLINNLKIKKEKIIKINNPIDLLQLELKLQDDTNNLFDKNVKNIVAVGNVSYRKGFDNLIKVFTYLKNDPIHLHIIGEGPDKETFISLKNSLEIKNIHFLGFKSNPLTYVQQADLFILSSRYEGFPNVLLEANACGTYILANDCKGGINEIILDKVNGEIHKIEDFEGFANKIKTILNCEKNKENIKNTVKDRFSKELILEKYLSTIKTLLK